ncbi:type III polyketide synthase [Flavihumibacter rivuli]|uniref:type III polyketide synthase n=1 Tax=Flavihumibacter rivuli TaxID=2838156 RepID=UPI001BDF4085|nr:type III polyketide synthase [Flavihumibacter rivuli]ULQ56483.1 type III polyketide synthase [Flavihumibacter rivuli]
MTSILSIGTAVPPFRHSQTDILRFMQQVYGLDAVEERKLRFLYQSSGIRDRYSVIPDYSIEKEEWQFYPRSATLEPFPTLEDRMNCYNRYAAPLAVAAIRDCLDRTGDDARDITHLITVSCTGMSAPGLDLELMDLLGLANHIQRTSVNFMGCYAAVHAMKIADAICRSDQEARVLIVCVELCTLHFQKEPSPDNIAASLLFGDGAAAMLLGTRGAATGWMINGFYSEVVPAGKKDMAWELSSSGFLMTLSGYVPDLIQADFGPFMQRALGKYGSVQSGIEAWCIHPGGKRILQAIEKSLGLGPSKLEASYEVLNRYGNMSSATILFVLQELLQQSLSGKILGAAFGPGLTMETFCLESAN